MLNYKKEAFVLFYVAQSLIVVVTVTLLTDVEEALVLKLITSITTVAPTNKPVFMIRLVGESVVSPPRCNVPFTNTL